MSKTPEEIKLDKTEESEALLSVEPIEVLKRRNKELEEEVKEGKTTNKNLVKDFSIITAAAESLALTLKQEAPKNPPVVKKANDFLDLLEHVGSTVMTVVMKPKTEVKTEIPNGTV